VAPNPRHQHARKLALPPAAVREKHDFNIDRRVSDFAAALDAPDMLGA
jgi:hypothetical protein